VAALDAAPEDVVVRSGVDAICAGKVEMIAVAARYAAVVFFGFKVCTGRQRHPLGGISGATAATPETEADDRTA